MRYKAAVLHETGGRFSIEDVELQPLEPGDVLVRLHASGLCHTDLEVIEGALPYPLPIVLGHEGAGVVERVGAAVTQVAVGDHVVCSWNPHCGHCFYCERDQPILCEPFSRHQPAGRLLDGGSRYRLAGGRMLSHFSTTSTHAQYTVVPESGAIAVPKAIPFDRACLIGCGVMTGVGAAVRMARVEAGSAVVVVGCGAVGLHAIQGARLQQADTIVAIDLDPGRLALARAMGATRLLGPSDGDAAAHAGAVRGLTAGRGADFVFECAGGEAPLQLALDCTRPGGSLTILGKVAVDRRVSLRFGSMMGERRILRSSYGGARPRRDFPWLARLYLDGRLKLDELITQRLPLERIDEGFDAMRAGRTLRTVLEIAH
jgi:S-(hydroxymethyl)glutathione dehydrogenase / alcohol dehydrogenase